jgi:hypothetical protein
MKRSKTSLILRGAGIATGLALLCTAAPSIADETVTAAPAAVAPGDGPAKASFTKFAQSWMKKIQRSAAEQKPTVRPGAANAVVTYRDYGDDFTVELRPTGHASAPYVGILRYSEQIFSCRQIAGNDCTLSSEIPVTEIFRFQGGRWIY